MNIVAAVLVGIVQGVFEWLPVSSEAVITLILTQVLNTDPGSAVNASIFLHMGTMFSALVYFREEYLEIFRNMMENLQKPKDIMNTDSGRLTAFLIVSTFFTSLIGGLIYVAGVEAAVKNPTIFYILISFALFLTGIMRLYRKDESRSVKDVNLNDSIITGLLQSFSIIPGISRSGITSFGFLYRDFDARSAFHLSFLMSVPAILIGNIGVQLLSDFQYQNMYILSTFVAGIVGYMTIDGVLKVADRAEIAYICFGLAIIAAIPAII